MRTIKITVYQRIDDEESTAANTWQVSDDGGAFDDSEEYVDEREAKADADEREAHYIAEDPTVRVITEVL
jgi:hypothetical protein